MARSRTPARPRVPRVEETSAGGLVIDFGATPLRAALIARHDRRGRLVWSLPKGHVEEGESLAEAAVREVREEPGVPASIIESLGVIDFWFMADDKRVHKTVHHFLMRAEGVELSDDDVEVAEVAWVDLDDARERLAYPDERALVERAVSSLDAAGRRVT